MEDPPKIKYICILNISMADIHRTFLQFLKVFFCNIGLIKSCSMLMTHSSFYITFRNSFSNLHLSLFDFWQWCISKFHNESIKSFVFSSSTDTNMTTRLITICVCGPVMQESITLLKFPQMTLLWEWFGIREGFCVVAIDLKDWNFNNERLIQTFPCC